ncbi:uncharacterized protein LOC118404906 [Branchiostoma floridae]|uniref:Uncharacterized protein LOC118404906 n=1 Tax=Branchiostoma floridae TaxID=7739 RepID=A0A9J7HIQ7_BRAFL|nr:uncharacterized protein LOC118404906 [Branchiostoma floridae]
MLGKLLLTAAVALAAIHGSAAQGDKPTSCVEAKSLLSNANDGEYTLYPFSTDSDVSLRVYCHDMASAEPKEFLTLPSGPDENYAIFFADRLSNAYQWQCTGPFQGQYAARGTTKFSKLRIQFEPSRIEVIGNDYTFAETTGPNDIAYGQAGDCYSARQGCAKGTFKVDLTGTGLELDPEVHWVMGPTYPGSLTINDMFISEDRKVASARCGGWCGSCRPDGGEIYLTPSIVPCAIDIVLVLDVSSSISQDQFLLARDFMMDFVDCAAFEGKDVRVRVISYTCEAHTYFSLTPITVGMSYEIEHLMRGDGGGETRTGHAIYHMRHTSKFGAESHHAAVILTDGQSDDDAIAEAEDARDAGIDLYAVVVGNFQNRASFPAMTNDPDRVFDTSQACDAAQKIVDDQCGM